MSDFHKSPSREDRQRFFTGFTAPSDPLVSLGKSELKNSLADIAAGKAQSVFLRKVSWTFFP
jgi:hypothetical protein